MTHALVMTVDKILSIFQSLISSLLNSLEYLA